MLGLKELIAMGVGGMVGGGIFSVLGLSVSLAGHAAPIIAFAIGGVIALLTGVSYSRLGAVLSTASAINATLFGTARLGMVMARDQALPHVFSLRERTKDIPWVSLCIISALAIIFVSLGNLEIISSFASSTFLLIFVCINLAAFLLRDKIGLHAAVPLCWISPSAWPLGWCLAFTCGGTTGQVWPG